jgi:GT2 family glycosyltransferase
MDNNLDNILGVLVLYKSKLEESETFISISKALKSNNQKLDLFVYDNSPEYYYDKKAIKEYPGTITYEHDESNPGICKPYNKGLEKAKIENRQWLLLLDQDTE